MKELRAAFPHTIPVFAAYVFLGITYGVLMATSGFPFWLPILTALLIYTGSMEFLSVSILLSSFHPLSAFLTAVMVGARHLFYGLSMLEKYRGMGWRKFYLIYTTSDETFALNHSIEVPKDLYRPRFYMWVSFLDQMYWVLGAAIGGILGSVISFDVKGLDFVMTAMFVSIFMNQWLKDSDMTRFGDSPRSLDWHGVTAFVMGHIGECIGIAASVIALIVFGPDRFMIPAMVLILIALTIGRKYIE